MQPDWPVGSHYLLKARTNYRKFNIHSSGAKLLNATKKDL